MIRRQNPTVSTQNATSSRRGAIWAPENSYSRRGMAFERPILVGVPHRALSRIDVLMYDYDALGVRSTAFVAGDVFQPWEPRDHWRGEQVPITLGDGAHEFDWGVTSATGHFLRWDDFFEIGRAHV